MMLRLHTVLALTLVAAAANAKGIREVSEHASEQYDISSRAYSADKAEQLTEAQIEDAEFRAQKNARHEAKAAGADQEDQDAAAQEAMQAVKFAAARENVAAPSQSSLRFKATASAARADPAGASGAATPAAGDSGASGAASAKPVGGSAFGISYAWPVIDDVEIDKQAEIVAEWSVRARYRIEQETNATAAVVGTRKQVIDFASSAHSLTGDALDAKNEPGEEVLRHLEKSQDDTVLAKEARRRLKVLKDYLRSVSAKRKIATKKRDESIAELLRLKVLRVNTAKQLWMTLRNKIAELMALLEGRLKIASKDADMAKQSEIVKEPKAVVMAKLDASERAQSAARHVKVYMNAVEYKAKCAKALLEEWQCKVMINCTANTNADEPTDEKPLWSTPTLDALADTMNEAISTYKDAKESVPRLPKKKADAPMSPVEKRIISLEKKYGTGEFAAGNQPGACKLEGGRVGHFVVGKGCVPFDSEKVVYDKEMAAGADAGASGAAGSGSGSDANLGKIEERIMQLEGQLK